MKIWMAITATSALFLASPVAAQRDYLTYQFTGNCEDCSPANTPATATLVLKDYRPGDGLSTSNLVSFTYNSNIVTWDRRGLDPQYIVELGLSGSLGISTGAYDVSFHEMTYFGDGLNFVSSQTRFDYDAIVLFGVPGGLDHGTGTWTLVSGNPGGVPEAATWTAMIAGFGMVGATMRRRPAALTART